MRGDLGMLSIELREGIADRTAGWDPDLDARPPGPDAHLRP
jgi:hypothetical protein